jgi:DNA-binding transcriptional MerR regulator
MNTTEVRAKLKIPRETLYYLEFKGYIQPQKSEVGRKEFRDYSPEEFRKLETIWKYIQEGYRYKDAYNRALKELDNGHNTDTDN